MQEAARKVKDDLAKAILSQIREDELVAMACDVVNIASPTGEELEMGRYMRAAMEAAGLQVAWQEVEEGRANVVGLWEGAANGKSLMFNGHMDTSNTGREAFLTGIGYKAKAVVKNGMIFGLGIYNMKGALVCYLQALRALVRAGVRLVGDVTIAAVVGEIEKTQWGEEFVGKEFRGYGVGTHHLVNHGVLADMCILGEPTDMQLVLGHYGTVWTRISTRGHYVHTGFTRGKQELSSVYRMKQLLDAIYAWIAEWEKRAVYDGQPGVVNVGCIRGGHPWRVSRTPDRTDVFLDVRVPPTMPLQEARRASAGDVDEIRAVDDAWPRMPDCSGVAPPRRPRRLSDSYFTLVGTVWVPQVVDDPTLPARILAGGRSLPRWRLRDECVTRVLFESGGRVSEVTGLTLGDWVARGLLQDATTFSKGSHGRRVKFLRFSSDTVKLLRRYVDGERCALDPRGLTCAALVEPAARRQPELLAAPLFLSARRTPLSAKTYRETAWNPACAAAGIDADVHQARHWYVTMAVRQIYDSAATGAEVQRRLRELIEYMKWRRGTQTLDCYEHYFDAVRHAEIQDRVHARLDDALRAQLATTPSHRVAAPGDAPRPVPTPDADEPEWIALRPFVSGRRDP